MHLGDGSRYRNKQSSRVLSLDLFFLSSCSVPLASSFRVSFPRREVTIVGRPDFPEKGTATTTTITTAGAFVYRPERIASCTQRTVSSPRRLPRLVIAWRFTDQRFTMRLPQKVQPHSRGLSRASFSTWQHGSPVRQVDMSTTYRTPSFLPTSDGSCALLCTSGLLDFSLRLASTKGLCNDISCRQLWSVRKYCRGL